MEPARLARSGPGLLSPPLNHRVVGPAAPRSHLQDGLRSEPGAASRPPVNRGRSPGFAVSGHVQSGGVEVCSTGLQGLDGPRRPPAVAATCYGPETSASASWNDRRRSHIFSSVPPPQARFVSNTKYRSFGGSIQSEVPVNPTCPNAAGDIRVPQDEVGRMVSQPRARELEGTSERLMDRRSRSGGMSAGLGCRVPRSA